MTPTSLHNLSRISCNENSISRNNLSQIAIKLCFAVQFIQILQWNLLLHNLFCRFCNQTQVVCTICLRLSQILQSTHFVAQFVSDSAIKPILPMYQINLRSPRLRRWWYKLANPCDSCRFFKAWINRIEQDTLRLIDDRGQWLPCWHLFYVWADQNYSVKLSELVHHCQNLEPQKLRWAPLNPYLPGSIQLS